MVLVLIIVAIVVALVAVLWALGRHLLFGHSLPRTSGRLALPGIREPVTIRRDRLGVPHVDAHSMEDAAFAMGFLHAQDRLWQLEFIRRVASGRVSEFAGSDGLPVDRFMRRVGLARVAAAEAAQISGDTALMLHSYADGVNSVINSGAPLPLEFRLLKLKPEPWQPLHSLLCSKLLALGLSLNWDSELQRFELLRRLGPEIAARLEITYPEENPSILGQVAALADGRKSELLDLYRQAAEFLPRVGGGSNSWVVAGARTTTGKPILCNDPHLPPSVPSIWYAAHIRAGDDFHSTGVTSAGLPFCVIGHNQNVAWGFTNSFADCQDLVIEEFADASATRFRTERGFVSSTVHRELIRVKGKSDVLEEVVTTRHGPIVGRIEDAEGGGGHRGLALQWTALAPGDTAGALLGLQRASDWQSFRRAFASFDAPSQNVVYADTAGHIGYFLCGRIPVRRRSPSGLPVPGWDGTALWERVLTIDEVPQAYDPTDGVIVTANNRVTVPGHGPYIGADYMSGYRARRIAELLSGAEKLDATAMRAIQMDTLCLPAITVAGLLGRLTCSDRDAERLRARLASFDGDMRGNRREPVLYEEFMRALAEAALRPLCGESWGIAAGFDLTHPVFGYPGNLTGRVTPFLLRRWRDDDRSLFPEALTWKQVVESALIAAHRAQRRHRGNWGRIHALPLVHQPLGTVRGVRRLFNAGRIVVGGNTDTVLATSAHPAHPHAAQLFAPSWRQVMDLSDWEKSTGLHYPGQSGQPGSPHYRDLVRSWRVNEPFPLAWSDAVVRRSTKRTLELLPTPGGV